MDIVTPDHLGGFVKGGDEATWFPDLWRWLVEKHGVRSVLDVGCGEGHSCKFFDEIGCKVTGIDGVTPTSAGWEFIRWDFTTARIESKALFYYHGNLDYYDLVWCCEFVEHVEEKYARNFAVALTSAPLVLMTHAFPGQGGHHHVNCQPVEYWRGYMAALGYTLDDRLTRESREISRLNTSPWNHYARSGLAFRRME